jgi:hypothetical protein
MRKNVTNIGLAGFGHAVSAANALAKGGLSLAEAAGTLLGKSTSMGADNGDFKEEEEEEEEARMEFSDSSSDDEDEDDDDDDDEESSSSDEEGGHTTHTHGHSTHDARSSTAGSNGTAANGAGGSDRRLPQTAHDDPPITRMRRLSYEALVWAEEEKQEGEFNDWWVEKENELKDRGLRDVEDMCFEKLNAYNDGLLSLEEAAAASGRSREQDRFRNYSVSQNHASVSYTLRILNMYCDADVHGQFFIELDAEQLQTLLLDIIEKLLRSSHRGDPPMHTGQFDNSREAESAAYGNGIQGQRNYGMAQVLIAAVRLLRTLNQRKLNLIFRKVL